MVYWTWRAQYSSTIAPMPVAIIAITQLRVSRRKARSMPKMGIQGTETSSGVSASAPGSRVASQTVDAPGASARRKNALRPIARTRTGPTRATTRWARSIVYIRSPSMGSGAGKGPRVFYGSGEGFPEDQSAAVGDRSEERRVGKERRNWKRENEEIEATSSR